MIKDEGEDPVEVVRCLEVWRVKCSGEVGATSISEELPRPTWREKVVNMVPFGGGLGILVD